MKHHAMKKYWGVALDVDGWSAARIERFTPGVRTPVPVE
jgi:hypothetical protein